jgi:pimeloyl-ACP methyl ester carboxylesterase
MAAGVTRRVEYRSPLDDSMQAYGVYLPDSPPPRSSGYPAVLHGHGYGWRVSTGFGSFNREWADRHGWVLINVNARGPNFYEGVGDFETLKVVEHAAAQFGLDRDRIYMTGGSMGGTGALRHGLRHPDVFAAVMGVDGWTDYRLWHKHWYARTDARDLIEEFRRPLLQAASPLYWTERGELGAIGHIVDGGDTIVWPENGLRLYEALREAQIENPSAFDHKLIFNPKLGHGRGTDYRAIYDFFRGRRRVEQPRGFHVETTVLPHGELYWGRVDELHIDGMTGGVRAEADGDLVTAHTSNLDAFTLFLRAGPAGQQESVRVYADGLPCYAGPPETLSLRAQRSEAGRLVGWQVGLPQRRPVKRPDLAGPVGDAFVRPFVVAWGTEGRPAEVARHRLEAQQFARDWNAFMVHGPGVEAAPETDLSPADLATHSLIIFGTLDSSVVLQRADAAREFPVRVRSNGVTVRDPQNGDRRYVGEQFGALMVSPNPLTDFSTYIVVANRRFFTKPDGGSPQLLGYDLEKLPWAYPDYLVFNNDQSQLPHVLNVNNKPPVTCYDAGYFVEAGFFDDHWQIDHRRQLRRVREQQPENHRLAHIAELAPEQRDGVAGVALQVEDARGDPVPTARVTGRWWGEEEVVASASTDEEGRAWFPAPASAAPRGQSFEVVGVMATGCTWNWPADVARRLAPTEHSPGQIDLAVLSDRPTAVPGGATDVRLMVYNAAPQKRRVRVSLAAPSGRVGPGHREMTVGARDREEVLFTWWPEDRAERVVRLRAEAQAVGDAGSWSCSRTLEARVLADLGVPLLVTKVEPADQEYGEPWEVSATLRNVDCESDVEARVHCAIMEAGVYPPAKRVCVEPDGTATVTWTGAGPLPQGEHEVRVSVEHSRGGALTETLAVR